MFDNFLHKISDFLNPEEKHSLNPSPGHPSSSFSQNFSQRSEKKSSALESSFSTNRSAPASTFSSASESAPQSLAEFVDLIKHTPKSVLSAKDRRRIAAVMSFDDKKVRDLMIPRGKMIFVRDTEILGPLTLDKLYKSGFNVFPVIDARDHVLGLIHTESLNALKIRETNPATKYLNPDVQYLHSSDSLKTAIAEIERTNQYYFLVLDELDTLAGFFSVQQIFDYLLK